MCRLMGKIKETEKFISDLKKKKKFPHIFSEGLGEFTKHRNKGVG